MDVSQPVDEPSADDDYGTAEEADQEGYWRYTLAALISPGALALAAFTLAASGFAVLAGPLGMIPTFVFGTESPIDAAKNLSYFGIGIGVVAFALALWSLLRPEAGPTWPRIVAGAAAIVALLVIFEYAVVLITAANTVTPEALVE